MQGKMITYRGQCHCGKVQFEIQSTLEPANRCNCSLCIRKGAVMTRVPADKFELIAGEQYLTLYQFNTRVAKHYFCKVCGIYPFHRPRTAPEVYSINTGCLEGVNPLELKAGVIDGKSLTTV
jgi:hypothetical protein